MNIITLKTDPIYKIGLDPGAINLDNITISYITSVFRGDTIKLLNVKKRI